MSTTKKAPQHSVPIFISQEAEADAAGASAEAVVVVEAAVVAAVAVVVGSAAVEDAAAVAVVVAFGSTGAAEAAWDVRDVQLAGGAFRPRLYISIRRRADRH
jgi:hypothetical protein